MSKYCRVHLCFLRFTYFICMSVFPACILVHAWGPRRSEWASDLLELEVEMAVTHCVSTGGDRSQARLKITKRRSVLLLQCVVSTQRQQTNHSGLPKESRRRAQALKFGSSYVSYGSQELIQIQKRKPMRSACSLLYLVTAHYAHVAMSNIKRKEPWPWAVYDVFVFIRQIL